MNEPILDARVYVEDVGPNDAGYVSVLTIEDDDGRKAICLTRESVSSLVVMLKASKGAHGD